MNVSTNSIKYFNFGEFNSNFVFLTAYYEWWLFFVLIIHMWFSAKIASSLKNCYLCSKGVNWLIIIRVRERERKICQYKVKLSVGNSFKVMMTIWTPKTTRMFPRLYLKTFKTLLYRPLLVMFHKTMRLKK